MKTSQEGIDLLILREGKRNKAYKDTKGIWTCGVGHVGPDVCESTVWSDDKVREVLKNDLAWAEKAVNSVVLPLKQHQFDALVSFVFNIGASAFNSSTMKKLINLGKMEEAAKQFDRWNIPKEIIGRRMSEKKQFIGT